MKTIFNKILSAATVAVLLGSMASCVSENPFSEGNEGLVKMSVMVNTAVTRATPDNNQELLDNCVIYVSSEKGLLHKWIGVENIPADLYLHYGSYTAEAWSGDSVPAAFGSEGKKFFKGIKPFVVESATTQVNVKCTLANVVASVEESTIDDEQVQDVTVTFSNSHGSCTFDSDNWAEKAYFMMASDDMTANGNVLKYTVSGKDKKGTSFTKYGEIADVQSAHEYRINFVYNPSEPTDGGAFIQIVIDDNISEEESEFTILGRPEFAWDQDDLEVGGQIIAVDEPFVTHSLRIAAYNGFTSIAVTPVDQSMFEGYIPDLNGFDLIKMTNDFASSLAAQGIEIETSELEDVEGLLCKYILTFKDTWLNSLASSNKPYELTVTATDKNGKTNETVVSIANTQKAIKGIAPLVIGKLDYLAVRTTYVTLPVTIQTNDEDKYLAIQYRVSGSGNDWDTVVVGFSDTEVKIAGLSEGKTYEYRAIAGEVEDGYYEFESEIGTFTTETAFTITNSSFEDWSTYSASTMLGTKTVTLPGSTGDKTTSFWGSGNEGAATANITLTDKSTDMVHSGTYSAKLESKSAVGVLAAGNIFVGEYVKTDVTNGVLSVGRDYDGSHPSAVSVYVNYRPGSSVTVKSGNESYVPSNFESGNDHGQIYIALTDGPVELRTDPDNQKLFDSSATVAGGSDANVLAYGEYTFTSDYGADGSLEKLEIKFNYNDLSKTIMPTHLVIVCSASKYGDYFSGSADSVMYLDDFELVYE